MSRNYITYRIVGVSILVIGLITLLVFGNLSFAKANPGGLDFLAHWQGTRSFLKNGVDPYSDQTATTINSLIVEMGMEESGEYRFVTSLISFLVFAPFSLVKDFTVARAVWMTFLELILFVSVWLVAKWLRHLPTAPKLVIVAVSIFCFYPMVKGFLDGSLAVIVFALLILAIHLLQLQHDEAAGVVLALTLIKPDMAYPFMIVILLWALVNKRLQMVWWLVGSTVLLIGFTMVLIPAWPVSYIKNVINFSAYNPVRTNEIVPTALAIRLLLVKNLALLIMIVYELIAVRTRGSKRSLWFAGLLLIISPLSGGGVRIEHLILIMPAVFIGLGFILDFWRGKGKWLVFIVPVVIVLLSWIFSGELIAGITPAWNRLFLNVVIPIIALMIMYWSRWWVIRQEKFVMEEITK